MKFLRTPDYNELFSGDPTWVTESIGGMGSNGKTLVTQIGKVVTVDDVLAEIEPYIHYYQGSGGGITVSGGEPTLQAPFVAELFKACKMKWNLHTTLIHLGSVNHHILNNC